MRQKYKASNLVLNHLRWTNQRMNLSRLTLYIIILNLFCCSAARWRSILQEKWETICHSTDSIPTTFSVARTKPKAPQSLEEHKRKTSRLNFTNINQNTARLNKTLQSTFHKLKHSILISCICVFCVFWNCVGWNVLFLVLCQCFDNHC